MVAQGNNQVEGEDYGETFAPVVKMTTVRTSLRLVASKNWEVYQMDVENGFLHGDLEEEVYMKLPPCFRHTHPCKKLFDALIKCRFAQSFEDYSLFSYSCEGVQLRVLIYVDDLVICCSSSHMVKKFKEYLSKCFAMKDLGKLKYLLGIEASRGAEGFFLSQWKYSLDIITETDCLGCKQFPTLMEQKHQLATEQSSLLHDPTKYRLLVGLLIYLLNTRPELCYSVHLLSQFMQAPTEAQWLAALHVVRY